jgi:hypothetical protein
MTNDPRVTTINKTIACLRSVILSGECWTDAAQAEKEAAGEALASLAADAARAQTAEDENENLLGWVRRLRADLATAVARAERAERALVCHRFTTTWCKDRPEIIEADYCAACAAIAHIHGEDA